MTLYVDTSRIGMHGIGRYSSEVIRRLDIQWEDLGHNFRRPLAVDAFNPRRFLLQSDATIYAPGFNAGVTRARQLLTVHDLIHLEIPSEGSALKRVYYDRIVRPAIRRSEKVFTVSETSKRQIQEWLADDSIQIINTGNGVSRSFAPRGNAWSGMPDYFVYVGNLREHKNVDVILDALKATGRFNLVMVTSDREEAIRRITDRKLDKQVRVLSGIEDEELATVYRGSLGVLMPSTTEGFGLPAAEALVCGRPVAYWSGCESVADIVGEKGIAVASSSDVEAWVDGIERLADLDGPDGDRVAETYDWDAVARVVNAELERLR